MSGICRLIHFDDMSAITGIYNLNGRPVDRATLDQMGNTLAHRGGDGAGVWCNGAVGVGHRMLWTTPESFQEQLPRVNKSSNLALTADARIDNREELITLFGLRGRPSIEISDSELILRAYEKWGEQCPEKLLGDFAFALWDGRRQVLFCARDPMGVKPLYYFLNDRLFAFATEIRALFALKDVPRRLNELQAALYIDRIIEEREMTFYQDVKRLPAAHSLTVSRRRQERRRYWSLNPEREIHYPKDEDYAEAFRELFTEAVRCRLRSAYPVGCAMSGGMDSSSIACTARDVLRVQGQPPLHTFSLIFPTITDDTEDIDERPFINSIVAGGGIVPHFVHGDLCSPLENLQEMLEYQEEPHHAHALSMHLAMYELAQKQGVRIFMEGLDGDSTISYGFEHLTELAWQARWSEFANEVGLLAQRFNSRPASFLREFGYPPLMQLARSGRWVRFMHGAFEVSNRFGASHRRLAYYRLIKRGLLALVPPPLKQVWRSLKGKEPEETSFVNKELARRLAFERKKSQLMSKKNDYSLSARATHARWLSWPLWQAGMELHDRAAARYRLEPRYPFFDRRVMEFCVALPWDQKLRDGWTRWILRKGMEGILPPEVQWRVWKSGFTTNFHRGLLEDDRDLLEEVLFHKQNGLRNLVDLPRLQNMYEQYLSSSADQRSMWDANALFRITMLGFWLNSLGNEVAHGASTLSRSAA